MKKIPLLLIILIFQYAFLYSQSCDYSKNSAIVDASCASTIGNGLNAGDYKINARDQITFAAGFSLNNTSGHTFTASTDFTRVQQFSDYSASEIQGSSRVLDKTHCIPGSINGTIDVSSSGSAVYNIPILVSPGSHGMQPGLSIMYNSQSGNGILGYGWHLTGLSTISKVNKNQYYDNTTSPVVLNSSDALSLDGQRLISTGTDTYSPENDPYTVVSFTSVNSYTVTTKEGTVIEYGNTYYDNNNSKFYPKDGGTPYCWSISKITDPDGNYIKYYYLQDNTTQEYRISEIKYTGNGSLLPYNSVKFYYDKRTDASSYYIGGKEVSQSMVLSSIKVFSEEILAYDYSFKYIFDGQYSKLNEVSLVSDGNKVNNTVINWGNNPNYNDYTVTVNNNLLDFYNYKVYLGDFNGDGLIDIAQAMFTSYPYLSIKVSLPGGGYTSYSTNLLTNISSTSTFYPLDIQVVDWNNDGKSEVLVHYALLTNSDYYNDIFEYHISGNNIVRTTDPIYSESCSSVEEINKYVFYYNDFNNDGLTDRIITYDGSTYEFFFNGSSHSSTNILTLNDISDIRSVDFDGDGQAEIVAMDANGAGEIYKFNGTSFVGVFGDSYNFGKPANFFTGDFNGDGKTDYINYTTGNGWRIFYSTGTGFIQGSMPSLGTYEPATTASCVLITDINNDNREDIVYAYRSTVNVYISKGSSFAKVTTVNASTQTNMTKVLLFPSDYNNDKQKEIIYVNNGTTLGDIGFKQIKFNNSLFDNLYVKSITNGFNNYTAITYKVYYDYFNSELAYPLRYLRAPVMLANKITTKSSYQGSALSDITYNFNSGIMHLKGLGFLGFNFTCDSDAITGNSVQTAYDLSVYNSGGVFYKWMKEQRSYKNGSIISKNVNEQLFSIGGDASRKFFYPLIKNSTSYDYVKGTSSTTNIATFNSTSGQVEKQIVTAGGWTVETTSSHEQVPILGDKIYRTKTVSVKNTYNGSSFNRTTSFTYGNTSYPLRVTSQLYQNKVTTEYTGFDSYGNITGTNVSVNDIYSTPNRATSCIYDSRGRFVISSTDAAGLTSTASYRSVDGAMLFKIDQHGLMTSTNYSSGENALTSITTLPDNNTITNSLKWTVGSGNEMYYTEKKISGGNTVSTYFNAAGQKLRETSYGFNGTLTTTSWTYDDKGNVKTMTDNANNIITYEYSDAYQGRIYKVTGLNTNMQYEYGSSPYYVKVTDKNFSPIQEKKEVFDAMGNIESVTATTGNISYTYWPSGKVKSITTGGLTTNMFYDDLDNQTSLVEPNSGTTSYEYNGFGQLKTQTDAKGDITTCNYDAAGFLTSKTAPNLNYSYVYSPLQKMKDLLTSTTRSDGSNSVSESYTYDDQYRTKNITVSGQAYPGAPVSNFVTSYTYDAAGQVASISYPSGLTANYIYNNFGFLTRINNSSGGLIWRGDAQNNMGQWTQYSLGNNLITKWGYDANKMLNSIKTGTTSNETSIQNLGFSFNQMGQLTSRTEGSLSETFTYDGLDRLTTSRVGSGTIFTTEYAESQNGNIKSTTIAGTYDYHTATHPHAVKTVLGASSPTGLSSPVITTSSFNTENKISYIYNSTYRDEFVYGLDGNRFRVDFKTSGTRTLSKVYIGNSEFGYNASGTQIYKRTFVYAPTGICAVYQDSGAVQTFYYVHTDYLGSWLAITDATGSLKNKYNYDAWGRPRNPNTWELKTISQASPIASLAAMQPRFDRGYTGHEMMCNMGLINMNGRLYDPYVQRFLSPDNYVQSPTNSQSYNRYSYCFNNPLKYTDPDGNWAFFDDLGAMLLGGTINWIFHGCKFNKEGLGYFGAGALAAEVSLYAGPMAGACILGAGNSMTGQLAANGWNFNQINWGQVVVSSAISGLTYKLGDKIDKYLSPYTSKFFSNITSSPVLQKALTKGVDNAVSGFMINAGISLAANPKDIKGALRNGGRGALTGFGMGFTLSGIQEYRYCRKNNIDPWTGEQMNANDNVVAPDGWTPSPSKKGGGTIYKDPNNPHNNMRVMPGNPDSPNPSQQTPYIKYNYNGVSYDVDGNPLPSPNLPESHIPVDLFDINKMPH